MDLQFSPQHRNMKTFQRKCLKAYSTETRIGLCDMFLYQVYHMIVARQ